jgi:AcrR family transcriptional regulator
VTIHEEMRVSVTSTNETAAGTTLRVVPQQARGKEKIARLLAAADRIIATEGVEAITTIRTAAEAGVSVGSLYRYLPNREAIIESLARHYLGMLEQQMDALVEQAGTEPVADPVGISVDAFAEFYRSHPGFRALWFSRHLTEETRGLDRAHKSVMAHRIRDVIVAQGLGRSDKRTLCVALTVQLTTDVMIQEAFRVNPRGDKALLEQVKIMIRSYLATIAG